MVFRVQSFDAQAPAVPVRRRGRGGRDRPGLRLDRLHAGGHREQDQGISIKDQYESLASVLMNEMSVQWLCNDW